MRFNLWKTARDTQPLGAKRQAYSGGEQDVSPTPPNCERQRATRGRQILSPALLAQIMAGGAPAEANRGGDEAASKPYSKGAK